MIFRISKVCSTYELTKQFIEIFVKNCAIYLKKNNLYLPHRIIIFLVLTTFLTVHTVCTEHFLSSGGFQQKLHAFLHFFLNLYIWPFIRYVYKVLISESFDGKTRKAGSLFQRLNNKWVIPQRWPQFWVTDWWYWQQDSDKMLAVKVEIVLEQR